MTQKEHDDLLNFTNKICRKIFKQFSFDAQEIFYEAFSKGTSDIKNAIANEAYASFLRKMSDWINKQKTTCLEKKCGKCKKVKDVSEFTKRFAKTYNFWYYNSQCKKCLAKLFQEKKKAGLIDYKKNYEYAKKHYSIQANRDKMNARRREWRKRKKENEQIQKTTYFDAKII
jgi:hypothetical protein